MYVVKNLSFPGAIKAFSGISHVTIRSALLSFSFQMCSFSNVADDLCLSPKLDVY